MNKDSFIVYDEWAENCEDLSDQEFGQLMRAVFKYKQTGENPAFSDRTMRACWKPIKQAFDRTTSAYDERCKRNQENGKKGGRPKAEKTEKPNGFSENPEKPNGFFENPPERERERDPYPDPDPERGRGRESSRSEDSDARARAQAPPADTTTTTLQDRIVSGWNQHDFVQKIRRVDSPKTRWLKTTQCMQIIGGADHFLELLDSLAEHAYLKHQPDAGYSVIYDWFINPENFQGVVEGRYKEARKTGFEGWEKI